MYVCICWSCIFKKEDITICVTLSVAYTYTWSCIVTDNAKIKMAGATIEIQSEKRLKNIREATLNLPALRSKEQSMSEWANNELII